MIKKVIQGIIDNLYEAYGDTYEYIDCDIDQGFEKGTFIIKCEDFDRTFTTKYRFKNNHLISLTFIPVKQNKEEEMQELTDIREDIWPLLEYITIDNSTGSLPVRGVLEKETVSDGALVIAVSYDIPMVSIPKIDNAMSDIEVKL